MKYDELGNRMKSNYESRTRSYLPRRSYVIIRLDGKAFHSYVKGLKKPFDSGLVEDMNATAMHLCKSIQGAKLAYVQSDEISILITDFDTLTTDAWFNYAVDKMCSVSASIATSHFNKLRLLRKIKETPSEGVDYFIPLTLPLTLVLSLKEANFDSRVFTIPSKTEVQNYFIWRQQDAVRNSISAVAQSLYSHEELKNKNTSMMQEMIFQKGQNWNNIEDGLKRGRLVTKTTIGWEVVGAPHFSKDQEYLKNIIPVNE